MGGSWCDRGYGARCPVGEFVWVCWLGWVCWFFALHRVPFRVGRWLRAAEKRMQSIGASVAR